MNVWFKSLAAWGTYKWLITDACYRTEVFSASKFQFFYLKNFTCIYFKWNMESLVDRLKASASKHHNEIVTELGLDAFCFNWGVYGSLVGMGWYE